MKGSNFIFDLVQLMYYKYHKVRIRRDGSYIDSPDCIKKKKTAINTKYKDDQCFQYLVIVGLNYGEIKSHPKRVLNLIRL